jgi:hypothetical protein
MSISVVLLPLAIAAVTVARERMERREEQGQLVCTVGTRMRDRELLAGALTDIGAEVAVSAEGNSLLVTWPDTTARFDRGADGVWGAHFAGDVDEARVRGLVGEVDAAYGRRVQTAVLARLRERAPAAGLRLDAERLEEDDSVTLVLTVEQGA